MEHWSGGIDENFFYRPYTMADTAECTDNSVDDDEVCVKSAGWQGLLLVHQTDCQKRLLIRYGSICLLDATYKTTRYAEIHQSCAKLCRLLDL